jgi:hypothetical protein
VILVPGNVVPNRGTGTRRDSCWNAAELDPAARPRRLWNSTALLRELDAPPRELDRTAA